MDRSLEVVKESLRRPLAGQGSAVKAQTAPPTLRSKPVLMRQTQMSLRQPQACLRVPRRPFVLLFTPLSLLNAGECRRGGPRVILRAGFTRMQRPFLCHKRAVAVERTNDAQNREWKVMSDSVGRSITSLQLVYSFVG